MGVFAQQHLQRERLLCEEQRTAPAGIKAEPIWRINWRTYLEEQNVLLCGLPGIDRGQWPWNPDTSHPAIADC